MQKNILKRELGFTAIEITMVATVIAIIALLILPIFRGRTDEAKVVAAQDDLDSILKSEILAEADTAQYFRLQDLDNSVNYSISNIDPSSDVPISYWNRPISESERQALSTSQRWKGAYFTVKKYAYLGPLPNLPEYADKFDLIRANHPALWRNGGPILHIGNGGVSPTDLGLEDAPVDRVPIDPWGQPYIFFGPGKLGQNTSIESNYGWGLIVSTGPNGVPGNKTSGVLGSDYLRENGVIGTGDDIIIRF